MRVWIIAPGQDCLDTEALRACLESAVAWRQAGQSVTVIGTDPSLMRMARSLDLPVQRTDAVGVKTPSGLATAVADPLFEAWWTAHHLSHLTRFDGVPDVIEMVGDPLRAYFVLQRVLSFDPGLAGAKVMVRCGMTRLERTQLSRGPRYRLPDYHLERLEQFVLRAADIVLFSSNADRDFAHSTQSMMGVAAVASREECPTVAALFQSDYSPDLKLTKADAVVVARTLGREYGVGGIVQALLASEGSGRLVVCADDALDPSSGRTVATELRQLHGEALASGRLILLAAKDAGGLDNTSGALLLRQARDLVPGPVTDAIRHWPRHRRLSLPDLASQLPTGHWSKWRLPTTASEEPDGVGLEDVLRRLAATPLRNSYPIPDDVAPLTAAALPVSPERVAGRVSVIVPFFEMQDWVDETLESIQRLGLDDVEVVVVDDGTPSQAGKACLARIEEHSKATYPVRVVRKANGGLASARNAGADASTGAYLLFLDADDLITPAFVRRGLQMLEQYDNIAIVSSWLQEFGGGSALWAAWPLEFPYLLYHNTQHATVLVRAAHWLAHGRNNPELRNGMEDYESFLSMHAAGLHSAVIPEPLFHYRIRKDSMARRFDNWSMASIYRQIYASHAPLLQTHATALVQLQAENGHGMWVADPSRPGYGTTRLYGDVASDQTAIRDLLAQGDARSALELARRLRIRDPASLDTGEVLAAALLAAGEPAEALGLLEDYERRAVLSPKGYVILARAQAATGNSSKAAQALRLASSFGALSGTWWQVAFEAVLDNQLDLALLAADVGASAMLPGAGPASMGPPLRAAVLTLAGHAAPHPDLALAAQFQREGRTIQAMCALAEAMALGLAGNAIQAAEIWGPALEHLNDDPRTPALVLRLSRLLSAGASLSEARTLLESAAHQFPEIKERIEVELDRIGTLADGIDAARRLLPSNRDLGIEQLQSLFRAFPDNVEVATLLGGALVDAGNASQGAAILALVRSSPISEHRPWSWFHLVRAEASVGRQDAAAAVLDQMRQLFQGQPSGTDALAAATDALHAEGRRPSHSPTWSEPLRRTGRLVKRLLQPVRGDAGS